MLEAILTPDELERTHLEVVTAKGKSVTSSTLVSDDLLLRVFVYDEKVGVWLYPPEDADGFTARLLSELEDFVAVSGFGWGERRG